MEKEPRGGLRRGHAAGLDPCLSAVRRLDLMEPRLAAVEARAAGLTLDTLDAIRGADAAAREADALRREVERLVAACGLLLARVTDLERTVRSRRRPWWAGLWCDAGARR